MDLATILRAVNAVGPVLAAAPQVASVFQAAGTLLSTDDQFELKATLAEIQRDNDVGHARLQAKLAANR